MHILKVGPARSADGWDFGVGQRGAEEDAEGFAWNWRKGTAIYQNGETRDHISLGVGNHTSSVWKCHLSHMQVWTLDISIGKLSSEGRGEGKGPEQTKLRVLLCLEAEHGRMGV